MINFFISPWNRSLQHFWEFSEIRSGYTLYHKPYHCLPQSPRSGDKERVISSDNLDFVGNEGFDYPVPIDFEITGDFSRSPGGTLRVSSCHWPVWRCLSSTSLTSISFKCKFVLYSKFSNPSAPRIVTAIMKNRYRLSI